jgi:hypothetical protein
MGRMNKRMRDERYRLLVLRDGEYCYITGVPGNLDSLVIDHLDNNPENNHLSNLILVTRSINHIKNPRCRGKKAILHSTVCVSDGTQLHDSVRATSMEFLKNLTSEPAFKSYLFREMVRQGSVRYMVALDEGAVAARCSQETIKRYIRKEVTSDRPYELKTDPETNDLLIQFRSKWRIIHRQYVKRRKHEQQHRNWTMNSVKKLKQILDQPGVKPPELSRQKDG